MDRPVAYLACLVRGHDWGLSRTRAGNIVCTACGAIKPEDPASAAARPLLKRRPLPAAGPLPGLGAPYEPPEPPPTPISHQRSASGGSTWTVALTCDACNAPLKGKGPYRDRDLIACAACGRNTPYGNAARRAAELTAQQMAQEIEDVVRHVGAAGGTDKASGAGSTPSVAAIKRKLLRSAKSRPRARGGRSQA